MKAVAKLCLPVCWSIIIVALAGCMKDNIRRTYKIRTPIYESLSKYRESIKPGQATALDSTGKIAVSGNYIFISSPGRGIHVVDNSNPSSPKNVSFINVPGNADVAISGNALYADSYSDLVTFDIKDPQHIVAKNFATNVFPNHGSYYFLTGNYYNYYYPVAQNITDDQLYVIVGWNERDTTIDFNPGRNQPQVYINDCPNCSSFYAGSPSPASSGSTGNTATSGSLSRFAVANSFLYTIAYDSLSSFDIADRFSPSFKSKVFVNSNSETIYPFKDKLFVGSTTGMYMFDVLSSPATPALTGQVMHIRSCDPVIADDEYAYVTLRDGTPCVGYTNELEVYNITDVSSPSLVKTYKLTHPTGLSKDGNILFICDGKDGLKVFNTEDINNIQLIKQLNDAVAVDVIAQNGVAIVVTTSGIYEYSYADLNDIHLLSKL